MKKKPKTAAKRVGACVGAAAISVAMLSGCNWFGEVETVYGPPPWSEQDFDPADNQNEDVYGPPPFDDYDPADEEIECVYGPPEDFGIEIPVSPSREADLP